jgi:hypothetical protein
LTATAGRAQVTLGWSTSTGATGYNVKRSEGAGGPYSTIARVGAPSYEDTNLVNGTTYYYVISAVSSTEESPNSAEAAATPRGKADAFSLSAMPASAVVRQSQTATYTVQVMPSGAFTGTVTFSLSGLPVGGQAEFRPDTVTGGGFTTLTTSSGPTRGTFSLTVVGTSGTWIRTVQVILISTK